MFYDYFTVKSQGAFTNVQRQTAVNAWQRNKSRVASLVMGRRNVLRTTALDISKVEFKWTLQTTIICLTDGCDVVKMFASIFLTNFRNKTLKGMCL